MFRPFFSVKLLKLLFQSTGVECPCSAFQESGLFVRSDTFFALYYIFSSKLKHRLETNHHHIVVKYSQYFNKKVYNTSNAWLASIIYRDREASYKTPHTIHDLIRLVAVEIRNNKNNP